MGNNPFEDAQKQISQGGQTIYSNTELARVSALVEGIKQLQDFHNILAVTDLSPQEIMLFSMAKTDADFWDIPEITQILRGLAIMKLSNGRKSRAEIIEALAGMGKKKLTMKDRIDGFMKGGNAGVEQ